MENEEKESEVVEAVRKEYEKQLAEQKEAYEKQIKELKEDHTKTIKTILSSGAMYREEKTEEPIEENEEDKAVEALRKKFHITK